MRTYIPLGIIFVGLLLAVGCNKPQNTGYTPSGPSSSSASAPASTPNQGLTNSKVETAVADLLSDWRIGGSVSVRGIQEIPQHNAAVADLQFNNFEFAVTGMDELIRARDLKPPQKSGKLIPSPDEMFPQKKITYSKLGKATLTKYNDGRWVLKSVNWHDGLACCGVKGNVEIR
ncbi:MAG: hypothetical protein KF762_11755 [Acidobacteria bacterium]|nr:hypothetical protein [Acidobacteriota bacterium]